MRALSFIVIEALYLHINLEQFRPIYACWRKMSLEMVIKVPRLCPLEQSFRENGHKAGYLSKILLFLLSFKPLGFVYIKIIDEDRC